MDDSRGIHQVFIYGNASYVVQIRFCNAYSMNF